MVERAHEEPPVTPEQIANAARAYKLIVAAAAVQALIVAVLVYWVTSSALLAGGILVLGCLAIWSMRRILGANVRRLREPADSSPFATMR